MTRWIARLCTLIGIPAVFAGATLSSSTRGVSTSSTTLIPLGALLQPIGLAACVIGSVSLLLYLRKLAERVPDAKLLRSTRQLTALFYALIPLALGCLALRWTVLASTALPESRLMFGANLAIVIVPTVLAVAAAGLYWFLMFAYRRSIKRVIAVAISYDTLFGEIQTEAVVGFSENERPVTRSPRAETGETGGESTDVDEVPSSDDIPCIHCGYNLRGLPEGGRCPECGTPIAQSSHGNLLSAADPAWLERVYRGQALVYAGCVALVTYWFLFNVTGSRGSLVVVHALGASSVVEAVLEAVLWAAAALLLLLGTFTTTTLDPRLSLTEQPIALRRFVRGSIVALVALVGCSYLVPTVVKQLGTDADVAALCGTVLLYASGLVFLSALVGICYYLAGLAMRIPDARLATRTRSKVVRFAGCIGILVLMVVWAVLTQVSGASAVGSVTLAGQRVVVSPMFLILVLILALVAVGYSLSLMVLMSGYRKAFRKALLEARKRATAQDGHI